MMGKVGIDLAVDASGFERRSKQTEWIHVAAPPMNGMQTESLALNFVAAGVDARRDVNLVSGALCSARHRKPMREEIPVFRHQIKNPTRHQTCRPYCALGPISQSWTTQIPIPAETSWSRRMPL